MDNHTNAFSIDANRRFIPLLLVVLCLGLGTWNVQAQSNLWEQVPESRLQARADDRQIIPDSYKTFSLDLEQLKTIVSNSPDRFAIPDSANQVQIAIPMPDGDIEFFRVFKAPVMGPDLTVRYPMIQTFVGKGVDDPGATIRFDITQKGFHAMIRSGQHPAVFIDPYAKGDLSHYLVYYQKDFSNNLPFQCDLRHNGPTSFGRSRLVQGRSLGDCQLRTYRLAMSCTGEYTQFHGGTKADGLAAITTTMNRVNLIFETDLGVTMMFAQAMDTLVFTDPQTDPFDGSSISASFSANQSVVDSLIGSANYDIGHVVLTQLGGSAIRGSVCDPIHKASAASGNPMPVGDPLDVEFVAHEMGHQYGASHTNNACNAAAFTSVEPGSGSTVMSPMNCNPSIQLISDPYFHIITIAEMSEYIMNGPGANCPNLTPSLNNPPTVAIEDSLYILPIGTPFKLTAIGADPDGDSLTYCWEQMDIQVVSHPPLATHESGPMFRSFEPVSKPYRYFPRLSDILTGTHYDWEQLPERSREMDFRVSVRDHAVPAACIGVADVALRFAESAGPFVVNAPAASSTWLQGATETVHWEVAGTDQAPVNCQQVDILLSTDGGFTYPITLASQVPNDGYHSVVVPAVSSNNARVMVVSSDNIFFNVSHGDFQIQAPSAPTFVGSVIPFDKGLCTNDSALFDLTYTALAGFSAPVSLSVTGLPAGVTASFSQAAFTPNATIQMTVASSGAVPPGNYTLSVIASSGTITTQQDVVISLEDTLPSPPTLVSPADGAVAVPVRPEFSWLSGEAEEILEIADNPGFGSATLYSFPVQGNQLRLDSSLSENKVYYWRIRSVNDCGEPEDRRVFCFQTLQENCSLVTVTNAVVIPPDPSTANSTLLINSGDQVTDIDISLEISTSSAGGIKADLVSPAGTSVNLFDRPRFPNGGPFGCLRDNILVTLDDEARTRSEWLELMCVSGSNHAVAGTFQPIEPLSGLDGEPAAGTWTLAITNESGAGAIESWSMNLCTLIPPDTAPMLANQGLSIPAPGGNGIISDSLLHATSALSQPSQIDFTLLTLPTEGVLTLGGSPVQVGATFTQADIDNQRLAYAHSNAAGQVDFFTFNVLTPGGGWIHADTFSIAIGTVGLVEEMGVNQLRFDLFPNPASSAITLSIQRATGKPLDLKMIDIHGRTVKTLKLEHAGDTEILDVQSLPAGAYRLLITDGHFRGSQTFVKY